MLFIFPALAEDKNWLHRCAVEILTSAAEAVRSGEQPLSWPEVIPANCRQDLSSRFGLRSRYQTYCGTLQVLCNSQIDTLIEVMKSQLNIPAVYTGTDPCHSIEDVPESCGDSVRRFFEFCFDLTSDLRSGPLATDVLRDELYAQAYAAMPAHVCPFCGIDRFDAPHPDLPRHHLDHYMPISLYPFVGVHLRNLVPMCARCNSSFKMAADVIKFDDGTRRRCVDPYSGPTATISLSRSLPFAGKNGEVPEWHIDFVPNDVAFETWDAVFRIRLRYRESLLDAEFHAWLGEFSAWVADGAVAVDTAQGVNDALGRYSELCQSAGVGDQAFLKAPMFRMLAESVLRNDQTGNRLLEFVRALCSP